MMKNKPTKIHIVTKNSADNCHYIETKIGEHFSFECHETCSTIGDTIVDRPLLHPAQLILFFTENWDENEISEDIKNHIVPINSEAKIFTFLFITSEDKIPAICKLIHEDDDFVLSTASPLIINHKISQLIKRGNLYKKTNS